MEPAGGGGKQGGRAAVLRWSRGLRHPGTYPVTPGLEGGLGAASEVQLLIPSHWGQGKGTALGSGQET